MSQNTNTAPMTAGGSKSKAWLGAMRLRTLPLAASCVLAGTSVVAEDTINWGIFSLTLLTTLLLQILSNLANDYGDFTKGTDNEHRVGPARAMQSGLLTKKEMQRALLFFVAITLLSGISLLLLSFNLNYQLLQVLLFFALGIAAIAAAIKYTVGSNAYGYRGLGDLFVYLFFGITGVCGTAFLYNHQFELKWLLTGNTIGMLSCAVLNLNNLRDHINDKNSGKQTLVVKLGFEKGKTYQYLLFLGSFTSLLVYIALYGNAWNYLSMLPFLIILKTSKSISAIHEPAALDPFLKKVAISTFLVSLVLIITSII